VESYKYLGSKILANRRVQEEIAGKIKNVG
jgi:hypothetical protein